MSKPALPPIEVAEDARQRAVRLLTDAYAYDVIDDVEFERRLDLLGLQDDPAGIAAVVGDLPVPAPHARAYAAGMRPTLREEGRILGFMSETGRKGQWRVPRYFKVNAFMCAVELDLRYASIAPGCVISVSAFMANVSILVPPGMLVEFGVDPFMGSAGSEADHGAGYTEPAVRVKGTAFMSEVKVRVRGYR